MTLDDEIKQLSLLPPAVSAAITSSETWSKVADIGLRQELHIDTIGALADAVKRMLFGSISPNHLMNEMRSLGISDARATDIARSLNEQIFKPLHKRMREAGSGSPEGNWQGSRVPEPALTSVPAPLAAAPAPIQASTSVQPQAETAAAPLPAVPPSYGTPMPQATPPASPTPPFDGPLPMYAPPPKRETARPYIPPSVQGLPPATPPKPYAIDPYREPIE